MEITRAEARKLLKDEHFLPAFRLLTEDCGPGFEKVYVRSANPNCPPEFIGLLASSDLRALHVSVKRVF